MIKYKFSNGIAIAPEKDMKMLEKMSKNGWHVTKMSGLRYQFESGEKHDYIYNLNMEDNFTSDMLTLYESSGWKLIISEPGYQIFRAESGTTPIFTDSESKLEVLAKQQKQFGTAAFISILLLIINIYIDIHYDSLISLILTIYFIGLSVFTVFPFLGLTYNIIRTKYNKLN